jgi:hypothetical protein
VTQIYVEAKVLPSGGVSSVYYSSKGVWVDAVNTFDALQQAQRELGPNAFDFTINGLHNSRAAFEKITGVATSDTDTFADTVFKRDAVEDHDARFAFVPHWTLYIAIGLTLLTLALGIFLWRV